MSLRKRTDYKTLYGTTGTVFPDNTTGAISESDMRQFGEDQGDSLLFMADVYSAYPLLTSGTNTYTATAAYDFSAYSFKRFYVKFANASTGAVTLNVSSPTALGAKKVYKNPTTQAGNGDIVANQIYALVYDSTLDSGSGGFQIVGSSGSGGSGTVDHWRGGWDASGDAFPVDADEWGSGTAGALQAGDEGYLTVGGNLTDVNGTNPWPAYTKIKLLALPSTWLVG